METELMEHVFLRNEPDKCVYIDIERPIRVTDKVITDK